VIAEVELDSIADALVGSAEEGGLSFEQKKRLSIAVELGASPSIIFLDEPACPLHFILYLTLDDHGVGSNHCFLFLLLL
jgi:ABC-type phosphate transport system ATPase subunit